MAYTDPTLSNAIKVKSKHISELKTMVDTFGLEASVSVTTTGLTYTKINALNMKTLQTAVNKLEAAFSGNCCQANCCQTCQSTTCQSCQSCQKCQSECNCNCDCAD